MRDASRNPKRLMRRDEPRDASRNQQHHAGLRVEELRHVMHVLRPGMTGFRIPGKDHPVFLFRKIVREKSFSDLRCHGVPARVESESQRNRKQSPDSSS